MAGQDPGGFLDVGQVGVAVGERGGDVDHRHVEPGAAGGLEGGLVTAGGEGGRHRGIGDVLHIGVAGGEPFDALLVLVEADHVEARLDRPHGEGKSDVPLADDDDLLR